jgi:PleD family two-component response regulator
MEKILIVDDDRSICVQVKTILDILGYETAFLANPEKMLLRLEHERFDLVLLDINMPRIDGLSLLNRIKTHAMFKKIPVVMLTGSTDDRTLAECFSKGASDYIQKPISELVLKSRVGFALEIYKEKQQVIHLMNIQKVLNENLEKQVQELNAAKKEAEERTAELQIEIHNRKTMEEKLRRHVEELQRFSSLAVGREEQMIKLKAEINSLLKSLGNPSKYKIVS